MGNGKERSRRQMRAAEVIHKALVRVLYDLHDHTLSGQKVGGLVNVLSVSVSADLRLADCYVVPSLLSNITVNQMLDLLERNKKFIRYSLTGMIDLKFSPEIRFFCDNGFRNTMAVNDALAMETIQEDEESC